MLTLKCPECNTLLVKDPVFEKKLFCENCFKSWRYAFFRYVGVDKNQEGINDGTGNSNIEIVDFSRS